MINDIRLDIENKRILLGDGTSLELEDVLLRGLEARGLYPERIIYPHIRLKGLLSWAKDQLNLSRSRASKMAKEGQIRGVNCQKIGGSYIVWFWDYS